MKPPPFFSEDETAAMRRALDLAWRGWGRVAPNPLVGAVVLNQGAVVGEGWHAEFGGPHAEVRALHEAGDRARGGTLVVSLEPCAHSGKTPPCTVAIRQAGVARVIAAIRDPSPDARGGLDALRGAAIDVHHGLCAEAAAAANAPFLFARRQSDRPFIALKLATSVDARIADARGRARWLSGPEAREWAHWLRAGFDAIAVGGITALKDDPQLTVRGPVTPRRTPLRVVFDRRASLNETSVLVRTARETPTWVVASPAAPARSVATLEGSGVRVTCPDSLQDGLAELRAAGVEALLCEGGGALGGRLLADGMVDRLYWIQAPLWLGEEAVPAFPGLPTVALDEAARWIPVERRALGPDTLLVLDRGLCLPES